MNKKIYQVYVTSSPNDPNGFWGFGDFLRGCIALYQYCKLNGHTFYISLQRHPLKKFLNSTGENELINSAVIYSYPNLVPNSIENNHSLEIYMFTNANCDIPLSIDCKEYFKSFLKPSSFLQEKIDYKMKELDIVSKEYSIVHVRTGDKYLIHNVPMDHNICTLLYNQMIIDGCIKDKTILLSDNTECSKILNKIDGRLICSGTIPVHIGHKSCSNNDVALESTLIDLHLIINSKEIYSYPGSGFPMIVSYVYDIPYKKTIVPFL